MHVPILEHGNVLVVSIRAALTDAELMELRARLASRPGLGRIHGLIVDVSAMDVMDSFAAGTLIGISNVVSLRGTRTIVVGIQPEVAYSMVQLGLTFENVETALDLDEGFALLQREHERKRLLARSKKGIRP